jgi:hypothetical protein
MPTRMRAAPSEFTSWDPADAAERVGAQATTLPDTNVLTADRARMAEQLPGKRSVTAVAWHGWAARRLPV